MATQTANSPSGADKGYNTKKFVMGDVVTIKGLTTTVEHNDKCGIIQYHPQKTGRGDGRYGVLLDGEKNKILAVRPCNLELVTTAQLKYECDHLLDYVFQDPRRENIDEQNTLMSHSLKACTTKEEQMDVIGRTIDEAVPFFQREIRESRRGFPHLVDKAWADDYLSRASDQASILPHMSEIAVKNAGFEVHDEDIMQWVGVAKQQTSKWEWYHKAKREGRVGDVCPTRCLDPDGYSTRHYRHSFSFQAYRPHVMFAGTTHVAVGFEDLGVLLAAPEFRVYRNEQGYINPEQPLRFVGIEKSAYAVAKTLVVWEMLQQTPRSTNDDKKHLAHVKKVAQVWFSAVWEPGTEQSVKAAIRNLLVPKKTRHHAQVQKYLEHWLAAPTVPLSRARQEIQNVTTAGSSSIGRLLKKKDRLAMIRYELTREFALEDASSSTTGATNTTLCGNTIMLDCPEGSPPLGMNESVFSALSNEQVLRMRQFHSKNNQNNKRSIVNAAEDYVILNLSKLANWATSGKLTVELTCAPFETAIPFIQSVKPWTMTWSNMCDYLEYDEFHRLAWQCSKTNALISPIHYGYSMQWASEVFGTRLLDHVSDPNDKDERNVMIRKGAIADANEAARQLYQLMEWEPFLRWPPPRHVEENCLLHSFLGDLQFPKWIQHFFEAAGHPPRGFDHVEEGDDGSGQGDETQCHHDGGHPPPCKVFRMEMENREPLSPFGNGTGTFVWVYDNNPAFDIRDAW